MSKYAHHLNPVNTPQSEKVHPDQVKNSAGGYTFQLDKWKQLERFLILGTEGGTYYTNEKTLTVTNANVALSCIKEDGERAINVAKQISHAGRAPKNDAAIFLLALAIKFGDENTRKAAYSEMGAVCRTGTHLFTLVEDLKQLGKGWGRGLKSAISNWYLNRKPESLATQVVKYQSRNSWSNADLLRLAHPITTDPVKNSVLKWVVDGQASENVPAIIEGFERIKKATSLSEAVSLIKQYQLPRECVPTQFLKEKQIWEVMLPHMGLTAILRNLGNMSKCGLLTVGSPASKYVCAMLTDPELLKNARVHPVNILVAQRTYQAGQGMKGSGTWTPVPAVVAALDDAYYAAFAFVKPTGKNFYLGLDVSGSMGVQLNGIPMTAREGAAAMAMTFVKTEPNCYSYGFTSRGGNFWSDDSGMQDLSFHKNMSLAESLAKTANLSFGRTDCALPMVHALEKKMDVDVFVVITDNETWHGKIHPHVALLEYRKKMNKPNAKMVVIAMTATGFTIADPSDHGMLDVVGFDTNVPQIVNEFVGF
jgi:60 kDa SS-A/Ro ribonucleoprotein